MMATEASPKNIVVAPPIAESEQSQESAATEDVSANPFTVKDGIEVERTATPLLDAADVAVTSADVSVNGGSDSEAVKSKGTVEGHVRTSSTVKKPISFKAVSVNKTFLAAKGATGPAPPKAGDKGTISSTTSSATASATLVSKPRLVAKSGNNLISASRTAAAGAGSKSGAAPDASAVWNKNRPAPIPEPKRVTDEELAQKYGIHLATRLQSDDPGRQANWADIDDDDDDWAPQSIEWSDGTKISMPQQVEDLVPELPKPATPIAVNEVEKTASPSLPVASTMKLGSMAGGTGRGLVLKGASEKPTLVAKPPALPVPAKSPWAPLPPMDKVAPIVTDIPSQPQQVPRFGTRDPHGFDGMPSPAKEIAADDFSRSWRDGNAGASKELYNSQSGRYEPVNDGRRGSRNEPHPRQLALLQRHQETQGPAEPSAAFQTHRANLQDPSYGRRRASSNVSGGSGNYARRLSRGQESYPPQDTFGARRGSLVAVSDEPLHSPSGHPSQRANQQQQWQSRASPVVSHASPASALAQPAVSSTPGIPLEDEVELQKKIMRESRELARKRRLDEEAREEAERKERIRLKLEAMGPPPESKKPKKDTPKDEKATPIQIQAREPATKSTVPPKLPIGESTGEVKQYGMMKVHPPEPVKAAAAPIVEPLSKEKAGDEVNINGIIPEVSSRGSLDAQVPPTQPQSWHSSQNAAPDRGFPPWSNPASHPAQGRSVWGPPSNDRTLGNGTFNPELSVQSSQIAPVGPGPIGPPTSSRTNGQFQGRGRDHYAQRPAPIAPPSRHQEHRPAMASGWTSGNIQSRLAEDDARILAEQEIAQASRSDDVVAPIKDTWRQVTLSSDGQRQEANIPSHPIVPGASPSGPPTWSDYSVRPRHDETSQYQPMEQGALWPQGHANETPSTSTSGALPPSRGSRFFPQVRELPRDAMAEERQYARPGSPSPPPPTMAGHPAYDGDVARPHVSLPRPPPVVKLPPAPVLAPIAPPKPASFAAAAAAAGPTGPISTSPLLPRSQAINTQTANQKSQSPAAGGWQDKINSLMGRRTSPPKSHALAVDSSSKHALDQSISQIPAATVSLPGIPAALDEYNMYETKPMAEECFEEQEMGYVPTVKVPNKAPDAAFFLAAPQVKPLPRKFVVSDVTSANSLNFSPQLNNEGEIVLILLPGMEANKRVTIAHKSEPRQKSNPRRSGQGRGNSQRHGPSPHNRGGRSRDTSSTFPAASTEQGSPSTTQGTSTPNRGRGRGGLGNNWAHRSTTTPPNAINV
ncbi:hypothetical protein VE01_08864 [Pseudogymnoascus verrucosus]|uniref:Uncharacterized protein n=1 Tax=Pseudogymnoascus verrucosus TaxID=342668 RepID=A0A1B8GBL3_9PEZI|nr:uncharacterized protein VE01_08864 [Pseudogymnoascus verrucosus]OBT93239.2 hypothetical protein VE01_08864 [Pseudogymnoascus verrucosus]